ncbi:hypothetical protein FSP39_010999 [Pinctada imbricata]|uniref:Globin domain-containing protein n=1 Tax=Pinctada imbricata TaxID=66713 RepID=A0AA88XVZ3_PINIB|nr:hypothetical protein FSP39_010999 [Pinctada imbricata]
MGTIKSKFKRTKSGRRAKPVKLPESSSARKTVDPRLPFNNYRQIFSIRNAWKTVARSLEDTAKDHLIRFLARCPNYKESFSGIGNLNTEEEMRESLEFETHAVNLFGLFDDVISNLENVDAALSDIHDAAQSSLMSEALVKDMEETFYETLRTVLDDRFTDALKENYTLLYSFITTEIQKACGATG